MEPKDFFIFIVTVGLCGFVVLNSSRNKEPNGFLFWSIDRFEHDYHSTSAFGISSNNSNLADFNNFKYFLETKKLLSILETDVNETKSAMHESNKIMIFNDDYDDIVIDDANYLKRVNTLFESFLNNFLIVRDRILDEKNYDIYFVLMQANEQFVKLACVKSAMIDDKINYNAYVVRFKFV